MPIAVSVQSPRGFVAVGFVPSAAAAEQFARDFRAANAGDLLPTFVNSESVYRYLDDTDGKVNALGQAIGANVQRFDTAWINRWTSFLVRWKQFFTRERADTHYLDARSVMADCDAFVTELASFDTAARAKGATPATPPVTPPKDDGPGFLSGLFTGSAAGAIVALGALYLLTRH